MRAGDIHDELGIDNRVPLVCDTLRGDKIQDIFGIELINEEWGERVNQKHAKNIWFTYDLYPGEDEISLLNTEKENNGIRYSTMFNRKSSLNLYGRAAVNAVEYIQKGEVSDPRRAWEKGVSDETESRESRIKECPRSAFLGLCEDGLVKNIPKGSYCNSNKNKEYAIQGVKILKNKPNLAKGQLWNEVSKKIGTPKNKNGQMDVVLGLWQQDLIS